MTMEVDKDTLNAMQSTVQQGQERLRQIGAAYEQARNNLMTQLRMPADPNLRAALDQICQYGQEIGMTTEGVQQMKAQTEMLTKEVDRQVERDKILLDKEERKLKAAERSASALEELVKIMGKPA